MKESFRYIVKTGLFLLPFFILVVLYVCIDPFMVVFKYENFNRRSYIPKNRDYVSTEVFLNSVDNQNYNSYIFGSSVALFVRPSIWQDYLPEGSKIFSFDASRENIAGIWSKIRYLDHKKYPLNNSLVVIDYNYVFEEPDVDNVLFMKDPRILHSSKYRFQYKHFIKIFDFHFMIALIDYGLNRNYKPYMSDYLLNERAHLDPITNEYVNISIHDELRADSIGYYERRSDKFSVRDEVYCEYKQQISAAHIIMLNEIKSIFNQNKTNYKIIIAPNYKQISFSKPDLRILREIFGEDNVFDFSGINSISEEKSNFYDPLHFKVYVGKQLLDEAYGLPHTIN